MKKKNGPWKLAKAERKIFFDMRNIDHVKLERHLWSHYVTNPQFTTTEGKVVTFKVSRKTKKDMTKTRYSQYLEWVVRQAAMAGKRVGEYVAVMAADLKHPRRIK